MIQFVSTAEEDIFATCQLTGAESGDVIKIAQMEGQSMLVKRQFCSSNSWLNEAYTLIIHEIGAVEVDTDGNQCTLVGEEYNPLDEVDAEKNINPF